MRDVYRVWSWVALATLMGVACSDDSGSAGRITPGATVWQPTTTPLSPDCADCEPLGELELDHLHGSTGGVVLMTVPQAVDDEVAQWSRCFGGILDCAEPRGAQLDACVAASSCPDACKSHFEALRASAPDADPFETSWNALEATFMVPTGPCSVSLTPGTLAAVEVAP